MSDTPSIPDPNEPLQVSHSRLELVMFRTTPVWLFVIVIFIVQCGSWWTDYEWSLALGVHSWQTNDWWGIFTANLAHFGWDHWWANMGLFIPMGMVIAYRSNVDFWLVTLIGGIGSSAAAWLINSPGTITAGASGLVFAYFGFLMVRAFVERSARSLLVGTVLLVTIGTSMAQGILPGEDYISWQGHLFGMLSGAALAWFRFRDVRAARRELQAGDKS